MLVSLSGEQITSIPRSRLAVFDYWKSRLSPEERALIKAEINRRVDEQGDVFCSSFLPGSDWSDTDFGPIWDKATKRHEGEAAKCFGLFCWETIIERPDAWFFKRRPEDDSDEPAGLTYFRIRG